MQVKLLQEQIAFYKEQLKKGKAVDFGYVQESIDIFQREWSLEESDFLAMYDRSLQNSHTRRMWRREAYEPKDVFLRLAKEQTHFAHAMFSDLFNEALSIDLRVRRFQAACDSLLEAYNDKHPKDKTNTHHHDYGMLSVYLGLQYPSQYTWYDHEPFYKLLVTIKAQNPPVAPDFDRFVKTSRILYTFLQKDEELAKLTNLSTLLQAVYPFYATVGR